MFCWRGSITKLNRSADAERERGVIQRLNEEKQKKEPTPETRAVTKRFNQRSGLATAGDELQKRRSAGRPTAFDPSCARALSGWIGCRVWASVRVAGTV